MVIVIGRVKGQVAGLAELLLDEGIEVIGRRGEVSAEGGFRQGLEDREVPVPFVARDERLVVRQHLGKQAHHEEQREDHQAPIAESISAEAAPGAPRRARVERDFDCAGGRRLSTRAEESIFGNGSSGFWTRKREVAAMTRRCAWRAGVRLPQSTAAAPRVTG